MSVRATRSRPARRSAVVGGEPLLPFALVETKLSPPPPRHGFVPRDALVERLRTSPSPVRLIEIAAPAGYGKTTLLAGWAERDPRPFAWACVDENDDDPTVLLTYVAAALDRIERIDPSVFTSLASPRTSVFSRAVPRLCAAISSMARPFVLVLDDLYLLSNRECLDALFVLAGCLPEGSQLAVASRAASGLPLARLRARGQVLEIGADELALDEAEGLALLRAEGIELPEPDLLDVVHRTEGWAAGLYLAALAMQAGVSTGRATGGAFAGDDRFVSDYLRSELLDHLPRKERRFLTRTSVLERMCGPLCDAVLETTGSAKLLESLEHSNRFVVPLDRRREWYRYHHLFREVLRAELRRREPDLASELASRASDWHIATGMPEAAIAYAQEAGDERRVAKLVGAIGRAAYAGGRMVTVRGWLGWLDARGALDRFPPVAALGGLVAALSGDAALAERWAAAAERGPDTGPLPDGSSSMRPWLALLRAMLCRYGVEQMRTDAEVAWEGLAAESGFRPAALAMLGIARYLLGGSESAVDAFVEAAELASVLGSSGAEIVALSELALVAAGRDDWSQVELHVHRAEEVVARAGLAGYSERLLVHAMAARLALHRGEPDRAREELTGAQLLRSQVTYAMPYLAVQARLELAGAHLALSDTEGTRTLLNEVDEILQRRPILGSLPAEAAELRQRLSETVASAPGFSSLTSAEIRLLPYLPTHLSFREIGERLYLSPNTVKSHAIAVYRKLGVSSRTAAVERARELGLLEG